MSIARSYHIHNIYDVYRHHIHRWLKLGDALYVFCFYFLMLDSCPTEDQYSIKVPIHLIKINPYPNKPSFFPGYDLEQCSSPSISRPNLTLETQVFLSINRSLARILNGPKVKIPGESRLLKLKAIEWPRAAGPGHERRPLNEYWPLYNFATLRTLRTHSLTDQCPSHAELKLRDNYIPCCYYWISQLCDKSRNLIT